MNDDIRKHFPILEQKIHNKPLIYFDNAATTQKPQCVIDAICTYYQRDNANIHRGVHTLAERATIAYEHARRNVKNFINAKEEEEIIFVRGTTEAINLVAQSYGQNNIKAGDEIVVTLMEHHSNFVPWQILAQKTQAILRIINVNPQGELDLEQFANTLNSRTKIVAVTHVSNTLGTVNPIKEIVKLAHSNNIPVVVDGAQAIAHFKVDVQDLDCDFYAFSGHKMYGPTGIGVLYGKRKHLDKMPPYQVGGGMIKTVTLAKTEFGEVPQKFEAGTPNIADTIGLSAAIDFLNSVGMDNVTNHEIELLKHINKNINKINNLKILGENSHKIGVISLVFQNAHPHDVATILDTEGIAVRAGNHCNMPLMDHFAIPGTSRVSLGIYNTTEELDVLFAALEKVQKIFS